MTTDSISYPVPWMARLRARAARRPRLSALVARPELLGLLGLTAILNLWNLSINGWANTYYSAAVRSMSSSWHDFLFASLDRSGLMTVDKPPLALWVEALSARIFGFHPLSILVPEALMGIVAVGLLYDLVRRRFGRAAGFASGLVLATTPITVAIARHNNPDEALILCTVAALWCAVRAFESGRTRWLVLCGVCVGLGFEAKMLVAMMVVPALALAWIWTRSDGSRRERLRALRQLLAGGAAMTVVALAWPLLVTLTPAGDRPWISGTSDNSIWSLIFGYNGLGRVAGETGGPGGAGGAGVMLGGPTGVFRLLESGLGDQAGWLLGFAVVAAIALLVVTRLRRSDPRTAWLIAIGGSFATTAIVFSFASGIFHPYYVSFLAPFAAALIGAGTGLMLNEGRSARVIAPAAIAAGGVTELVVLHGLGGALPWATPLVIAVGGACVLLLALALRPRTRAILVAVAMAALLAAPAVWAAETLGHATSSTFPAGGPASAQFAGGPGGGFGGGRFAGGGGTGALGRAAGAPAGPTDAGGAAGRFSAGAQGGWFPGRFRGTAGGRRAAGGLAGSASGFGAGGFGGFGDDSAALTAAIRYATNHGGGTIGVESQSSAATVILSSDADVAGLGGFSGRESTVSASWLAQEVSSRHLRWVLIDNSGSFSVPGDTRTGSEAALSIVAKTCPAVTLTTSSDSQVKMYDCQGEAAAILAAARR